MKINKFILYFILSSFSLYLNGQVNVNVNLSSGYNYHSAEDLGDFSSIPIFLQMEFAKSSRFSSAIGIEHSLYKKKNELTVEESFERGLQPVEHSTSLGYTIANYELSVALLGVVDGSALLLGGNVGGGLINYKVVDETGQKEGDFEPLILTSISGFLGAQKYFGNKLYLFAKFNYGFLFDEGSISNTGFKIGVKYGIN